ncbi:GNAT family N-acetyltransferase [Wukongibacter baidiensis]|uniref:GNAT family N-acetyltransferase n=1 Tax=Wukongibacter baidiensis TaxID=1723361 RepID=UPI003D7F324E
METRRGEFLLSNDKELIDIEAVYIMLSKTYWAASRPKEKVEKAIKNSICYGIYLDGRQIGFTRIVTDEASFAWICDVVVDEEYRGKGLGKWMFGYAVEDERIKGTLQLLATKDAHELYKKFGFDYKECMFKPRD